MHIMRERYVLSELTARSEYFKAQNKPDFDEMEKCHAQWREGFKRLVRASSDEAQLRECMAILDDLSNRGEFMGEVDFFRRKINRKTECLPKPKTQAQIPVAQ